jgi:hypothetical protein
MRVGVDGARAAGAGNCVGADRDGAGMEHGVTQDTERTQDMERHGTHVKQAYDAGVQTLGASLSLGQQVSRRRHWAK